MVKDYLDYVLEDDNTSFGGVSFNGETVRDFLDETGIDENITIDELNIALLECGIREIGC